MVQSHTEECWVVLSQIIQSTSKEIKAHEKAQRKL